MNLSSGIYNVLMPMISKNDAPSDNTRIKETYLKLSKLSSYFAIPICLFCILLGGDFIAIWMGEKFRNISGNILIILTISYFFFFVQNSVAYPILMGTSRLKFPTILMSLTATLNLILSIWWGKVYGIIGVAWGTTVPNILNCIGIVCYMCITFKLPFKTYCINGIIIPLSGCFFFAAPALGLKSFINIDSYAKIAIIVLVSSVVYTIILFIFYIEKSTKESLIKKWV
jgi:O-antigen/teichoic acid export membrane protein